jgi:menaquinone-specific isochorismate synthase
MLLEWLKNGTLITKDQNQFLIGWGDRQWASEPIQNRPNWYFPDYFLTDPTPWFTHEHFAIISSSDLLSLLLKDFVTKPEIKWQSPEENPFKSSFHELKDLIQSSQLQKGVPYTIQRGSTILDPRNRAHMLYHTLSFASKYPVFPYGFWDAHSGLLGATPEILFSLNDQNQFSTMACAGTSSPDLAKDLLNDPKERAEHQHVIDGILKDLSPYIHLEVGNTTVVKLKTLEHLVTSISGKMGSKVSLSTLIPLIHPTPALGTFPRQPDQRWLRSCERRLPRQRFGAPVGYQHTDSKFYVGIRNAQWKDNTLFLMAGCGVVAESVYEREWNEIQAKFRSIQEILQL